MLLCVNIGNSNIALGLYGSGKWHRQWRLSTVVSRTVDEYELLIHPYLGHVGASAGDIDAFVIASVVPALSATFARLSKQMFNSAPFLIGSNVQTGLNFRIDNSGEMGADLIANAVAGYRLVNVDSIGSDRKGVIVVDFGTALTFTVVNANADVCGVVIAPGINGAVNSLAGDTAQLPHVELEAPPQAIGTNTVTSIQSGVVFGFTGLVESMVRRIQAEMHCDSDVVATGGLYHVVAANTKCFDYLKPWLHLEGARIIYGLNSK